jgi:hypothetical protein
VQNKGEKMETMTLTLLILGIFFAISIPTVATIWAALILNKNIDRARGTEYFENDLPSG